VAAWAADEPTETTKGAETDRNHNLEKKQENEAPVRLE